MHIVGSNIATVSGPMAPTGDLSVVNVTVQSDTSKENMLPATASAIVDGSDVLSTISEIVDSVVAQLQSNRGNETAGESHVIILSGKPREISFIAGLVFVMLLPFCICSSLWSIYVIIRHWGEDEKKIQPGSAVWIQATSGRQRHVVGDLIRGGASRKERPLCEELQAPGTECIIALPSLHEIPNGTSTLARNVVSKTGLPICKVALSRINGTILEGVAGSGAQKDRPERIFLNAYHSKNLLGFCEFHLSHTCSFAGELRPFLCFIYHHTGHHFATLEHDVSDRKLGSSVSTESILLGGAFVVKIAATAKRYRIAGDIAKRQLVVTEDDRQEIVIQVDPGQCLPFPEAGNSYYCLKIQPGVDAGVVMLSLLAIDRFVSSCKMSM
jgi:hypothetical protein